MFQQVLRTMYKDDITKADIDALEHDQWHEKLWQQLTAQQLHEVGLQDAGDFLDVCALHRLSGYYAAPIPFIEHTLACNVLAFLKEPIHDGIYTITRSHIVPWARAASYVVVIERHALHIYDIANAHIQHDVNIAAEPRDTVTWQGEPLQTYALTEAEHAHIRAMITMSSVYKITGAVERAVQLAIQFSKEREQFGRPIHRFQLVQQHIAKLAGEEAVLQAACGSITVNDHFGMAAACIRADEAVQTVTTSAHQVHAAIGVTHEHTLHHTTRRLWAWREEGYNAREWKQLLANDVATYEGTLWEQLTAFHKL